VGLRLQKPPAGKVPAGNERRGMVASGAAAVGETEEEDW